MSDSHERQYLTRYEHVSVEYQRVSETLFATLSARLVGRVPGRAGA